MCANDTQRNTTSDDVWDTDSDHEQPAAGSPTRSTQLDREWEARKQQFYNAGYREGLEEGKEVTLQQGFNAGFAEGAQAGYEFGLVKSTLQVLAAHLAAGDSRRAKVGVFADIKGVQELLQQVTGLSNKAVMIDTCKALLAQQPVDVISQHLRAALTLQDGAGASSSSAQPSASAATAAQPGAATPADAAAAAAGDASSSSRAAELPSPLQLVKHFKQELQQLGFEVGSVPPLTVVSSRTAAAAAEEREGSDQ